MKRIKLTKLWLWTTGLTTISKRVRKITKIGKPILHFHAVMRNSMLFLTPCSQTESSSRPDLPEFLLGKIGKTPDIFHTINMWGHPSIACQTLRRILHAKIYERTLELPCKKQAIDTDLLLKRREKEVVIGITCSKDDDVYRPWNNGASHMRPFESLIGIGKKPIGASTPSLRVMTRHSPS